MRRVINISYATTFAVYLLLAVTGRSAPVAVGCWGCAHCASCGCMRSAHAACLAAQAIDPASPHPAMLLAACSGSSSSGSLVADTLLS